MTRKAIDGGWLTDGHFTSAGENVLAGSYAIFPVDMADREIRETVAVLVSEMEQKVAGAYSVRLLGIAENNAQNTLAAERNREEVPGI